MISTCLHGIRAPRGGAGGGSAPNCAIAHPKPDGTLVFLFLVFIYLIFLEELVLTRDTDGDSSPLFPTRLKIQISESEAILLVPH